MAEEKDAILPDPGIKRVLNRVLCLDALLGLKGLPDNSVDCVVTSPPYWNLRDYGVDGQLGLEAGYEEYVDRLHEVFDEVRRVLKDTGTCWVNLGDTYGGGPTNVPYAVQTRGKSSIIPNDLSHLPRRGHFRGRWDKCLVGIPERFMLGMVDTGWTLRNKIVWHKPNGMPSSVKDRFACRWEYLYLFTKSKRYYFDLDAVREPHRHPVERHRESKPRDQSKSPSIDGRRLPPRDARHPLGKNPGDHWSVPTQPLVPSVSGMKAHCAVFPEKLIERPIRAGCPPGGVVLDPFMGSGTTAVVAQQLGRHFIGFDLNPDYVALAEQRLASTVNKRDHEHA